MFNAFASGAVNRMFEQITINLIFAAFKLSTQHELRANTIFTQDNVTEWSDMSIF